MPQVYNIRDYRGKRLPSNTVKVDRGTPYGNPYVMGGGMDRFTVLYNFVKNLKWEDIVEAYPVLHGHNLMCWCHYWDGRGDNPFYCHADIWLVIVWFDEGPVFDRQDMLDRLCFKYGVERSELE